MGLVRYDGMVVFTPDPKGLASFYEDALGFTRESADGEDIGLRVATSSGDGSIEVYLHPGESRRVDVGGFSVENVDEAAEQLRQQGATVLSPPADTPWGTREVAIADPDGNTLLLRS